MLAKHKNWMERNEYEAGDSYHWSVESHEERLVSYEIATKTLLQLHDSVDTSDVYEYHRSCDS